MSKKKVKNPYHKGAYNIIVVIKIETFNIYLESIKNCYLFLEKLQISGIFNEEKEMMDLIICDQNLEGNWRI